MSSRTTGEIEMARRSLVGLWEKQEGSSCAKAYPDRIEFGDHPRFLAQKGPEQSFIWWDVGGYEVVAMNQIRIQTASDEFVLYGFWISRDDLTFVDPNGCEFRYRRVRRAGSAR